MFGWLKEKNENTRIYTCTKEVLWDLEDADLMKRGRILAMANLYREIFFNDGNVSQNIISNPLQFSRTDLMKVYAKFEDARNTNQMQFDLTQKKMHKLGIELPGFSVEHFKNYRRSLEIWMVILSAGMEPDLRDQARQVWSHLETSREVLPKAINQLFEISENIRELNNSYDDIFLGVSISEWLEICTFRPAIFEQ